MSLTPTSQEKLVALEDSDGNITLQTFHTQDNVRHGNYKETFYKLYPISYDDENEHDIKDEIPYETFLKLLDENKDQIKPIDIVKCTYVNNVLHGDYKRYDNIHGELISHIQYDMGILHGRSWVY